VQVWPGKDSEQYPENPGQVFRLRMVLGRDMMSKRMVVGRDMMKCAIAR